MLRENAARTVAASEPTRDHARVPSRPGMSGERPKNPDSDLPTHVQAPVGGTPVPDGTLVVAHDAGVKSASSMRASFTDAPTRMGRSGRPVM